MENKQEIENGVKLTPKETLKAFDKAMEILKNLYVNGEFIDEAIRNNVYLIITHPLVENTYKNICDYHCSNVKGKIWTEAFKLPNGYDEVTCSICGYKVIPHIEMKIKTKKICICECCYWLDDVRLKKVEK